MTKTIKTTVLVDVTVEVEVELTCYAGYPGSREEPPEPPGCDLESFEVINADDMVGMALEDFDFIQHLRDEQPEYD